MDQSLLINKILKLTLNNNQLLKLLILYQYNGFKTTLLQWPKKTFLRKLKCWNGVNMVKIINTLSFL